MIAEEWAGTAGDAHLPRTISNLVIAGRFNEAIRVFNSATDDEHVTITEAKL